MPSSPDAADRRHAFGQRLKEARQRAGLSQRGLAAKAGMDQSFLSEVETGRHSISLERVHVLAAALDVKAADLVDDTNPGQ